MYFYSAENLKLVPIPYFEKLFHYVILVFTGSVFKSLILC